VQYTAHGDWRRLTPKQSYRSDLKSGLLKFSRSHIRRILNETKPLMSKLASSTAGRGLPARDRDSRLTMPSVIRVLCDVRLHQSVAFNPNDVGMGMCFRQGWIHPDMDSGEGNYCTFPTPLHAMFVEFEFCTRTATPFPFSSYPSPQDLWLRVLKEYSKQ
jgi:hypothetical protein